VLLVVYVLGMAFTLVYSGEHYLFDIVIGWLYTVVLLGGTAALARYRRSRSESHPELLDLAAKPARADRSTLVDP
jgi:membrane-associated phospholipid phosphatase